MSRNVRSEKGEGTRRSWQNKSEDWNRTEFFASHTSRAIWVQKRESRIWDLNWAKRENLHQHKSYVLPLTSLNDPIWPAKRRCWDSSSLSSCWRKNVLIAQMCIAQKGSLIRRWTPQNKLRATRCVLTWTGCRFKAHKFAIKMSDFFYCKHWASRVHAWEFGAYRFMVLYRATTAWRHEHCTILMYVKCTASDKMCIIQTSRIPR